MDYVIFWGLILLVLLLVFWVIKAILEVIGTHDQRAYNRWVEQYPREQIILGFVEFYDAKKGFGFLKGRDGTPYYFDHLALSGVQAVDAGHFVSFVASKEKPKQGQKRGVLSLRLIPGREYQRHISLRGKTSSKALCLRCGRRMVPRTTYREGTFCPFCGASYKLEAFKYVDF